VKLLSSDRDDRKQAPAIPSISRNVVQGAAAFSMKDKVADSLGMLVSMVGLLGVLFSAMFLSQYIGFLRALALSAIVAIVLAVMIRVRKARN
jgi:hypothetical protein